MLERFHPEVRVLAHQPGAGDAEVSAVQTRYPALPRAIADLMRETTELELAYRGRYLRLYGPEGCIEMDEAYSIAARIPGAIVIGDNGGGEAILYIPGKGLHRVGYGALDPDEMHFIANWPGGCSRECRCGTRSRWRLSRMKCRDGRANKRLHLSTRCQKRRALAGDAQR